MEMIDFKELNKNYSKEDIYRKQVDDICNEIITEDKNEVTNQIIKDIEENISNRYLLIILDIFFELKVKKFLAIEDINNINKILADRFKEIKDKDIKFYLIGYLIENDLSNEIGTDDEEIKGVIDDSNNEHELAEQFINIIKANNEMSVKALRYLSQEKNDEVNIFKIGEIIRKNMYEDSDLIEKFNELSSKLLRNIDNKNDDICKILEFVFSIYQDKKLLENDRFDNLNLMRKHVFSLKDKFLDNMFIEIACSNNYNCISNASNDDFKSAARGSIKSLEDLKKLDNYLIKIIKSRKKVRNIKLNCSYTAKEILDLAKIQSVPIDLNKIIDELNIQYYEDEFEESIEGYSLKLSKKDKAAIIINKQGIKERKRFTLAHEIGHICRTKDRMESEDELCNLHFTKEDEKVADRFAGELLLPASHMNDYLKTDLNMQMINEISSKYEVSLMATAIRLVKMVKGSYIFLVYKNNKLEKKISSEEVYDFKMTENIEQQIINADKDVNRKFIDQYLVDIQVLLRGYKYVLINDIYSKL